MSYQVLARKWRPHQFADVVGQSHVLTALGNALAQNRLHHAYLFSGTRGVGKTTIARIFAKGLNCEQGITATPCGVCNTCREIDEGRFVDLLEIDAASRTKVEDTRELLDNVQYKPSRGRFKVYLIDEVHMLSRHSFNALLKTLEEPPEYVKFILATTDPQKLPVTILSRCLQFHLKHLDNQQIQAQLEKVLTEEKIASEIKALALLARAAEGSMRDALSLTDQAIALGNGKICTENVATMLGTLNTDQALYLLESVAKADANIVMSTLGELASVGIEWDSLLRELAAQLHRVAMYQALPASLDESSPDAERIALLSQTMAPQDVQLCYQIALQGRQDLSYAPDGRTGLEMTLLRMLAFRPVATSGITPQSINVPTAQPTVASSVPAQPNTVANASSAPQMQPEAEYRQPPSYSQPVNQQPEYNPAPEMPASVPQQQTEQATVANPPRTATSGLLAARNQLRSQTKRGQQASTSGQAPKKDLTTPAKKVAPSVLERIASKQVSMPAMNNTAMPASMDSSVSQSQQDEDYRWKPSMQTELVPDTSMEVAPRILKQALEHEKTPEMIKSLVNEAAKQDSWSDLANRLEVGKLIQQLALNSAFEQTDDQVTLYLRPEQKHLNGDKAREQLNDALNVLLETKVTLSIALGAQGRTPLELREELYQTKVLQAKQSLEQDPNVAFICQRFSARLDEESIRPI